MKVLQLNEIIDVPDNYIRCSVCGKYEPIESFIKEGDTFQSRTNCITCYSLPFKDMQELKESVKALYNTLEYKRLSRDLSEHLYLLNNSYSKDEVISNLLAQIDKIKKDENELFLFNTPDNDYTGVVLIKQGNLKDMYNTYSTYNI